jgi:hypothetical protein
MLATVLMLVHTISVVLFQVRASRGSRDVKVSGAIGLSVATALAIGIGKREWVILARIFLTTGVLMRHHVTGSWLANQSRD